MPYDVHPSPVNARIPLSGKSSKNRPKKGERFPDLPQLLEKLQSEAETEGYDLAQAKSQITACVFRDVDRYPLHRIDHDGLGQFLARFADALGLDGEFIDWVVEKSSTALIELMRKVQGTYTLSEALLEERRAKGTVHEMAAGCELPMLDEDFYGILAINAPMSDEAAHRIIRPLMARAKGQCHVVLPRTSQVDACLNQFPDMRHYHKPASGGVEDRGFVTTWQSIARTDVFDSMMDSELIVIVDISQLRLECVNRAFGKQYSSIQDMV